MIVYPAAGSLRKPPDLQVIITTVLRETALGTFTTRIKRNRESESDCESAMQWSKEDATAER